MNCLNKGAAKAGRIAAIFAFAFTLSRMAACTEVDDRLGEGLLPENQQMKVEVTTFTDPVKTYLYRADSLPSSRLGHAYLGRTTDANGVFGARTNSVLVQFLPFTLPYEDKEGYGFNPIIDSAHIRLTIDEVRGDVTREQSFDVYEVREGSEGALSRDSIYRANFPIEERRGEKLFGFTHSGRGNAEVKLTPTDAGRKYLDSIVHLGWDDYKTDSLFYAKFQGLYITPAQGSPADAAVYAIDLSQSGLELFVRNHDSLDVAAIYDTLQTAFSFRDTDAYNDSGVLTTLWDNVSVNMADFDYAGSELGVLQGSTGNFTDTLASSPALASVYVQPMGGVGTMLRFGNDFVDGVMALGDGNDIAINQAMMYINLKDGSEVSVLDASMVRLGSYLNVARLRPIPDYMYASEATLIEAGKSMPYNGYLNRSNGYYELDITSYIQQLAKSWEEGYVPPAIYLAPEALNLFGIGESVLEGAGSDRPVEVRITYTIIQK